ncbi:MAG: hypothetical protein JNM93_09840 [Bacteriovoracaceae bacterium]|nr:hypothetical protein [Bacteriovoracaceae bacterium]
MKFVILISLFFSLNSYAKLLDKIIFVINEKIVVESEIQQIMNTLSARREISPFIYEESKLTHEQAIDKLIRAYIIRDKLSKLGYVVTDDAVEGRIQTTESRLGLKRDELIKYLKGQGLSFDEYFEIIRESTELNIFNGRIIAPLVSITEQEIKNAFYRENSKNMALTFNYSLIDFMLKKELVSPHAVGDLQTVFKDYQLTGNIPELYASVETAILEDISNDSLDKGLAAILKQTDEGDFSKPIEKDGRYHVFFVKKKDLKESEKFLRERDRIQNDIFLKYSKQVTQTWFEKEKSDYFIQILK